MASPELIQELRSAEFVAIRIATNSEMRGVAAKKNECHENARKFVELNPDYEVVGGWLQQAAMIFARHSIVRSPSGELICVTLSENELCGFAVHLNEWDREPFATLDDQVFGISSE